MSPTAAGYGLAFVIIGRRFNYADRGGRVRIFDVQIFDNGPSDFHYGVVPIHIGKRMNLARPSGSLLFPDGFDWNGSMWHGKAYGCVGCREICRLPVKEWGECEPNDLSWVGGKWFRLTPDGRSIALPKSPEWARDPGPTLHPTFDR